MNNKLLIIISVLVFVFIGSFSFILYHNFINPSTKNSASSSPLSSVNDNTKNSQLDSANSQVSQEYVRYGQSVTSKEVDKVVSTMANPSSVTKDAIIDSIANGKLLIVKAEENNIIVSDNDVEEFITSSLNQTGMSIQDYHDKLSAAGISEDEYKAQIKDQIMIAQMINKTIKPQDYAVSDKEVDDFINAHMSDYQFIFDENDTTLLNHLKARIKNQMIESKKSDLIIKYVKSLQEGTN